MLNQWSQFSSFFIHGIFFRESRFDMIFCIRILNEFKICTLIASEWQLLFKDRTDSDFPHSKIVKFESQIKFLNSDYIVHLSSDPLSGMHPCISVAPSNSQTTSFYAWRSYTVMSSFLTATSEV